MLPWLSAVLVAAVSNIDNGAVGVAYGIRDRRIGATPNLIIAVLTMAATGGAMTFGRELSTLIPSALASALGSAIIVTIGAGTIISSLRGRHAAPAPVPSSIIDRIGVSDGVSYREAVVLGVALSMNNLGTGVGAGVAGVPPLITTVLAGVFSLLCLGCGSRAGMSLGKLVGGRTGKLISGMLLVGIGAALRFAG